MGESQHLSQSMAQLPPLSERSKPYSMFGEPPCPRGPLTCPECGAVKKYGDMDGACGCENGHSWWDSNSPEYVEMRRRGPLSLVEQHNG